MKHKKLFSVAVLALMLISALTFIMCQKEVVVPPNKHGVVLASFKSAEIKPSDINLKGSKPITTAEKVTYTIYYKPTTTSPWTLLTRDYFTGIYSDRVRNALNSFSNPVQYTNCTDCVLDFPVPLGLPLRVFTQAYIWATDTMPYWVGAYEFTLPVNNSDTYAPIIVIPTYEINSRIIYDVTDLVINGLNTSIIMEFDEVSVDLSSAALQLESVGGTFLNWTVYTEPPIWTDINNRPLPPIGGSPLAHKFVTVTVNNGVITFNGVVTADKTATVYQGIAKAGLRTADNMKVKYKITDGSGNVLNGSADVTGYTQLAISAPTATKIAAFKTWAQPGYNFRIKFSTDFKTTGCVILCHMEITNAEQYQNYVLK